MKKIFAMLVVVIAFVIGFSTIVKAEEVIINGYNSGEFAVKGEVQNQLQKLVVDLKARQKTGEQLQIAVVGSADVAGKAAVNDQLARLRAEQVAAYLAADLLETKINAWSKGDEANVRQVKVNYSFVALNAPQPVGEKPPVSGKTVGIFFGCLSALCIFIFVGGYMILKKSAKPSEVSGKKVTKATKVTIELEEKGLYETDIEFDPTTGRWLTPFRHIKGGERMWEESEGDARRTTQKCWRQMEKYSGQIEKLITDGTIRKIKRAVA